MADIVMYFHVQLVDAKDVMGMLLFVFLTRVMQTRQAIFSVMPEIAGVLKPWRQQLRRMISKLHEMCWEGQSCVMGRSWQNFNIFLKIQTYRHTQHTASEARYVLFFFLYNLFFHKHTRAEIVRWVAESKRPFQIVNDRGFQSLMKTGRPAYHIPSPETVSHDVKKVFVKVRKRIAKMLQVDMSSNLNFEEKKNRLLTWNNLKEYEGALNFATDAWTSPNHKPYVAVTVHWEKRGVPVSMLLDMVEVAVSHSGLNLADAFAKILDDFGISDKVGFFFSREWVVNSHKKWRFSLLPATMRQIMTK